MSEGEKCEEKIDEVADWENAGDDAIIASVAERQKQLEQYETKLAVEQEQLKIQEKTAASGSQGTSAGEKNRPEVGDGPIRLLRRQNKGNQPKKTDAELEAEAAARAAKALEDREALYQQTRDKIFGGEQQSSSSGSSPQKDQQEQPPQSKRDHLSDVPMKRADTRKTAPPRQQQQQPPPLNRLPMMPPQQPPTTGPLPPWMFNNVPMQPPPYGAPIPISQPPPYWFCPAPPNFNVNVPPPSHQHHPPPPINPWFGAPPHPMGNIQPIPPNQQQRFPPQHLLQQQQHQSFNGPPPMAPPSQSAAASLTRRR